MTSPFFSVIIPVYNGVPYLREAVQSVLDQSFTDWELFVVDDQSTDATPALVQTLQAENPKAPIHYLRMPVKNGISPGRVRNFGLQKAQGTWVAFLDHDDRWLPQKLSKHYQAIGSSDAFALVHSDEYLFNDEGWLNSKRGRLVTQSAIPEEKMSGDCFATLFEGNPFGMSCTSVKRSVLQALNGFDENIVGTEDYDLLLRVAAEHAFHYIPEPLNCYRLHGGNLHNRQILMIENTIKVFRKMSALASGKIRSLGLNPKQRLVYLYHDLAQAQAATGDIAAARQSYRQALSLNPFSLGTWARFANPKANPERPSKSAA